MTGSALFDFMITAIILVATGVIFFAVIDKASPDPTMNKVAKIAVGTVLAVVLLIALKGLLFGGGAALALSPGGLIGFAIGVIIILVVLYFLDAGIQYLATLIGAALANMVKVVVFAIILIALLVLVDNTMFSGRYTGPYLSGNTTGSPSILRPERR